MNTTFYQAVSNGYDKIKPLMPKCQHCDYEMRVASIGGGNKLDASIWNRYHKIATPPELCDFSVYMDGNIGNKVSLCDLHAWVETVMIDRDLAICRHNDRKCVFVEVEACVGRGKITHQQADLALDYLHRHKMPKNFGLWECGIILRRPSATWLEEFQRLWFLHLSESKVFRDQLWLPLTLFQMQSKVPPGRFLTLPMNVRKNDYFTFKAHA